MSGPRLRLLRDPDREVFPDSDLRPKVLVTSGGRIHTATAPFDGETNCSRAWYEYATPLDVMEAWTENPLRGAGCMKCGVGLDLPRNVEAVEAYRAMFTSGQVIDNVRSVGPWSEGVALRTYGDVLHAVYRALAEFDR